MTIQALSEEQCDAMDQIIGVVLDECQANAIAVCGLDGTILSEKSSVSSVQGFSLSNIAALAIGSFAATRELANIVGETRFKSVFQKGQKTGILIYALGDNYLVMLLFGENTPEGLARLCLKKISPKLESLLDDAEGQSAESAGVEGGFEVERKADM